MKYTNLWQRPRPLVILDASERLIFVDRNPNLNMLLSSCCYSSSADLHSTGSNWP